MVNQQLLDYIKQQLQQGVSREQIKSSLMTNGWQEQDIEEGFAFSDTSGSSDRSNVVPTQTTNKPWKVLAICLSGVLLIGGGVYFASQKLFKGEVVSPTPEKETPIEFTALDCKQDFDCFVQASQNCKSTKVDHTITTDIFGVKQTTKSLLEIKGAEENKCAFSLRTEKIDLVFPASVPPDVVSQQKEIYKKLEGRSGNCKFNTSDLTAMLSRWKLDDLSTEDFKVAECSGTYFEQPSSQNGSQNTSCHLQISFGSIIINGQKTEAIETSKSVSVGSSLGAYAVGYQGQASQISWRSSNVAIAKIEPNQDGTVFIKSMGPGKATITANDNSIDPPCASTINWESTQ